MTASPLIRFGGFLRIYTVSLNYKKTSHFLSIAVCGVHTVNQKFQKRGSALPEWDLRYSGAKRTMLI